MSYSYINPYNDNEEETCSASFVAQQQFLGGPDVGNVQTEAQFNKSKLLGEWGVIVGKVHKGEIPDGTKVLTYTNPKTGTRGYLKASGGKFISTSYTKEGKKFTNVVKDDQGEILINSNVIEAGIPQAVAPKPKPEPIQLTPEDIKKINNDPNAFNSGSVLAVNAAGDYIKYAEDLDQFLVHSGPYNYTQHFSMQEATASGGPWLKPDGKDSTSNSQPATAPPPANPPASFVAAPTPTPAVNPGSDSVGSMSHEDVAAMFVKIKDDLAKEQGLNIKGANPGLDEVVYKAIGDKTGYTSAEVKAKIDAYKADGNKLSALKKKVMNGSKKVPEGKPQPTKQTAPSSPLAAPQAKASAPDPKPNEVPTVATPKLAEEIKEEVQATVAAEPTKVYTDEDIAAAYIIAKDHIVAASNGKWTLYTKSDELDLEIAIQVGLKTGFNPTQQKVAIANYLGSGKKLSVLKKQLIKQGAFEKKADSLKKSGTAKTQAEKDAEVAAKADAGYTPTSTPATGNPPTDTGKPAPKRVENEDAKAGTIDHITQANQLAIYQAFKAKGHLSYLSSQNTETYEALLSVQTTFKANGQDYTLLQLLRVIDAQGAIKFKAENGKLFEKKTATWLTTPAASDYLKAQEVKLAKLAEQAKLKAEAEKAAKLLEANQPPLPADSALFDPDMNEAKSFEVQKAQLAAKPFGPRQRAAITHYTSNSYTEMNNYLRGISTHISETSKKALDDAQAGLRPNTKPMIVRRGTGASQFVSLGVRNGDTSLLWGITGKSFKDEGFLSTSSAGRAAFGGEVAMEIELPVGAPSMYVDYELMPDGTRKKFSRYPGEKEMLLGRGMTYKILNVRKEGNTFVVRARVVDWPGKDK